MRKLTTASAVSAKFDYEVASGISRRIPIIVVESKLDKITLRLMLARLIKRNNMDLWFYWREKKERCVLRYPGWNQPMRYEISSFVHPMANATERALACKRYVLNRILPRIGTGRVFAFHDSDFNWSSVGTQLVESASLRNQTIVVFTNSVSKGLSTIIKLRDANFLKTVVLKTRNYSRLGKKTVKRRQRVGENRFY